MKNVVLFGASGNIGKQTLEILKTNKNKFKLIAISVGKRINDLETILEEFKDIKTVYSSVSIENLKNKFTKINFVSNNIEELIYNDAHIIVNALSGFFGLKITLEAIKKEKILLNANKESFVVAGNLIQELQQKFVKAKIYPVDSEHCAIFQCLEVDNQINNIYLTASGGPFRNLTLEEIKNVNLKDALNHPNWNMGSKITIDSATMFNKAFEILEAYHLFKTKNIITLVHPNSIIHSMVEFKDGSIKAQLSVPDMKQVINYFFNYPDRVEFTNQKNLNFKETLNLQLKEIDQNRFIPIKMALGCLDEYNSKAICMNAANEVCVEAFLNNEIEFYQITEIVSKIFHTTQKINYNNYNDICAFDKKVRELTISLIKGDK
ncbi:1-deoxy-D-xylulose-5-phosphate reductoisomerase [Spiroplasma tabanidicola]|uniref:1-deoxy-D-xylulose 5-phosphate reductoisomerase n=1 Tax=Spiroplasma tabanidicola TaxID=324079 RepID=A0A6I6CB01_9MOLU|nr:1-deoxy-D-xylulose-5-phosphate reductoisomerase [Spiroplasma tabanidicola]QGS52115.1 1-deoxy-D-xylulose 5-phosphate reductoisomerase [Spiroplasma tabanidicola]